MTVIDYADAVFDVLAFNKVFPLELEDHEVKWLVECHKFGDTARECAYGIADCRDVYRWTMRQEQMWDRVDEQLRRAA